MYDKTKPFKKFLLCPLIRGTVLNADSWWFTLFMANCHVMVILSAQKSLVNLHNSEKGQNIFLKNYFNIIVHMSILSLIICFSIQGLVLVYVTVVMVVMARQFNFLSSMEENEKVLIVDTHGNTELENSLVKANTDMV